MYMPSDENLEDMATIQVSAHLLQVSACLYTKKDERKKKLRQENEMLGIEVNVHVKCEANVKMMFMHVGKDGSSPGSFYSEHCSYLVG